MNSKYQTPAPPPPHPDPHNCVPHLSHKFKVLVLVQMETFDIAMASFSIRYLAMQLVNACDMLQASYCMAGASVSVIIFPYKRAKNGTNNIRHSNMQYFNQGLIIDKNQMFYTHTIKRKHVCISFTKQ